MVQKKIAIWLTGLSASGKTTIAKALRAELTGLGIKTYHLDGDEVRAAAKENFGFTKEGRDKNIQLAVKIAREYQDQEIAVIASFISPYREHRQLGKEQLLNFIEVFVDAPLEVCEQRDPKGLYKKARAGEIEFFTGISDAYENPLNPDIHLKTHQLSVEQCVQEIISYLTKMNLL